MGLIALLFAILTLISCGANNVTGQAPLTETQNTLSTPDFKARLKLTTFTAGVMRVDEATLSPADLDAVVAIKQEQNIERSTVAENFALYFSDIDERLRLLNIVNSAQQVEMELILDGSLSGNWGWIGENGSQTSFEALKNNSSRMVIKNQNKDFILALLGNRQILALWLESKTIPLALDVLLWGKVQPLSFVEKIETDHKFENVPRGLVRIEANLQHYALETYEQEIRYEHFEEAHGRGNVPRRVVSSCRVKMAKKIRTHSEPAEFKDMIEFDQDQQPLSGAWWDSDGETTVRLKRSWIPKVVSAGLQNLGTCRSNMRFLDALPSTSNVDIASRVVISAEIYRVP